MPFAFKSSGSRNMGKSKYTAVKLGEGSGELIARLFPSIRKGLKENRERLLKRQGLQDSYIKAQTENLRINSQLGQDKLTHADDERQYKKDLLQLRKDELAVSKTVSKTGQANAKVAERKVKLEEDYLQTKLAEGSANAKQSLANAGLLNARAKITEQDANTRQIIAKAQALQARTAASKQFIDSYLEVLHNGGFKAANHYLKDAKKDKDFATYAQWMDFDDATKRVIQASLKAQETGKSNGKTLTPTQLRQLISLKAALRMVKSSNPDDVRQGVGILTGTSGELLQMETSAALQDPGSKEATQFIKLQKQYIEAAGYFSEAYDAVIPASGGDTTLVNTSQKE